LCHNKFVKKVKKSHKKPTEYVISLDSHIIPKIGTLANISNTIFTDLIYLVQIKDKKSLIELLNFWTRESQETVISRLYQLFSSDTNKQTWFYNNIVIPYSNLHQRQFTIEFLVKNPLLNPTIGYENPNIPNLGEYLLEAVMRKDATTIINTINRFDIDRQREILNYLTNSLSFNPQLSEWFLSHIQIPYTNLHSNVIIIGGSLDEHYKEKYINMKKKYVELKKLNK